MGWDIFPLDTSAVSLVKKEWFDELREAFNERANAIGEGFAWQYSPWSGLYSVGYLKEIQHNDAMTPNRCYPVYKSAVESLTRRYFKKYGDGNDAYWRQEVWEDICQSVFGQSDWPDRGHWLTAEHFNDLYHMLNYVNWIEVPIDHAAGLTNYRTDGIGGYASGATEDEAQAAAAAACTQEYDLSNYDAGYPLGSRDYLTRHATLDYLATHNYHTQLTFESPQDIMVGSGPGSYVWEYLPYTINAESEAYIRLAMYHDNGRWPGPNAEAVTANASINGQAAGSITIPTDLYWTDKDVYDEQLYEESSKFVWRTILIDGSVLHSTGGSVTNTIVLSPSHAHSSYVSLDTSDDVPSASGTKKAYFHRFGRLYFKPSYEYQAS